MAVPAAAQVPDDLSGRISLAGSRFIDNTTGYGLATEVELDRANDSRFEHLSLALRRQFDGDAPDHTESLLRYTRAHRMAASNWGVAGVASYEGDGEGPIANDTFLGIGFGYLSGDPGATHLRATLAAGPRFIDPETGDSETEAALYAGLAMRADLGRRVYLDASLDALQSETGLRSNAEIGANVLMLANVAARLSVAHRYSEAASATEETTNAAAAITFSF